jgi:pimeloyl-ACP methyl ester carboxylesterase
LASGVAPDDQQVVVRGLKLHTQRRPGPARPPLLLLHGIGGSLTSWGPLLRALPDRDVIMVDGPGTGRSDLPLYPLRMTGIADCMASAVKQLGLGGPVDVLGYSLGGMVAQELVHRHAPLVRRLVLVNTIMDFSGRPPSLKVHLALLSSRRYTDRAAAEQDVPLLAGGRTARDPAALASVLCDRMSHPPSWLGYRYQQWAALGWSSRFWLRQLRVPTLVLHGADDPVVHVGNAHKLADRIPDAELEIVDGAGHMLLFDEPEKAAAILEPFLGRASEL